MSKSNKILEGEEFGSQSLEFKSLCYVLVGLYETNKDIIRGDSIGALKTIDMIKNGIILVLESISSKNDCDTKESMAFYFKDLFPQHSDTIDNYLKSGKVT